MKTKQLFNMIKYDIRFSFRKNRSKWFFALLIQLFLCFRIFQEIDFRSCPSELLSALWPVMSGEREYLLSQDSSFQLPAYWIFFHGYLYFLIGFYPVNELYLGNGQTLIRASSKNIWMVSKFVSVCLHIFLYYGCFFTLLLVGNWKCNGTLLPENEIIGIIGVPIFYQSLNELFLAFLILPILVSITLGEIQVILSFFFNPVFAFMLVIAYLIASVFWTSPFFIGNFAMLYRQSWISNKPELSVRFGMILCIILIVISFIAGMVLFQKKEILPEE